MNDINKNGKAFNGNWFAVGVSVCAIVFVALVVLFA